VPSQHFVPHIFFGLDPMMVSTVILCTTYGVIIWDKLNRAIVALLGASVMIVIGALDQNEALKGIDWNTIGLLTGMMILVSISRRSGMFEYLAIWSAQKAKANPAGILLLLQVTTAVVSALLDNVTTVLLVVPVTLAITKELDVPPYPFLFAEVFASNIGGTATLIGDPPNILIGSLVGLAMINAAVPRIARATGVVQMAGYNTTFEALAAGLRPVLVPRRNPRREQAIRASRLTALGVADTVDEGVPAEEVDWLLGRDRLLPPGALAAAGIRLDGAERAAAAVTELARVDRAPAGASRAGEQVQGDIVGTAP